MNSLKQCLTSLLLFFSPAIWAQPGLRLREAEERFLANNLLLLAEQYQIEAAKARIIQASLWENPYVSAEFNAINPEARKAFDVRSRGQKAAAIQQLLYMGGKKKNEVELARANADMAKWELQDLLRNLRYQLRTAYFSVYYDEMAVGSLNRQLSNLDTLIQAYTVQTDKGNLPLKDLVRLQSLYMNLKSERTVLQNSLIEERHKLGLLLAADSSVAVSPDAEELARYHQGLPLGLDGLYALAAAHRPDVQWALKNKEAAQWNLRWQKSLGVPDLTVGASYDQRGGAFNNQVNLTLGVPLRLWNKNQGAIRAADAQLSQAMTVQEQYSRQLRNEVSQAYQKYLLARSNYQLLDPALFKNFDAVFKGVYQNFQRRNISLIEFTDFMESYYQNLIQFIQIQKSLTNACEEINYTTGTAQF